MSVCIYPTLPLRVYVTQGQFLCEVKLVCSVSIPSRLVIYPEKRNPYFLPRKQLNSCLSKED